MEGTKYCYRCGAPMDFVSEEPAEWSEDESVKVIVYKCNNCGATHTATTPEIEEREDYPFYNGEYDTISNESHGYDGLCLQCGTHIVWQSDFMRSEVWGDISHTPEATKRMEEISEEANSLLKQITELKKRGEDTSELEEKKKKLDIEFCNLDYSGIDENDDSLVSYCVCPHCGTYHEIVDAKPSEYKDYPIYKENGN